MLVRSGSVRLGTLAYYRSQEQSQGARLDAQEGRQRIEVESAVPETLTRENAPWHMQRVVKAVGTPILSHGGTISVGHQFPNAYIYCMTLSDDAAVRTDFGEFGVAIADAEALALRLTRLLRSQRKVPVDEVFLGCCHYSNKVTKLDSVFANVDPAMLAFEKPLDYTHQREVRAVWRVDDTAPDTLDVTCTDLRALCRRLY